MLSFNNEVASEECRVLFGFKAKKYIKQAFYYIFSYFLKKRILSKTDSFWNSI